MASPVPASGSSSGSTPQGSSQNTSASRRTRSVGTKLTDEEYAQLESLAAAQGVTPGECVRELVLRAFPKTGTGQPAAEATVAEQTVLSEVLALRTILINIIYDQANGHEIAPERMRELIAKADAGKVEKALERLKENSSATENGR
jgi:hypothetical protein